MPRLSSILNREKSVEVTIGKGEDADVINVRFKPNIATQAWFEGLLKVQRKVQREQEAFEKRQQAGDENEGENGFIRINEPFFRKVLELVSGWDIADDKDKELSADLETIQRLPFSFLVDLMSALMEALVPNQPMAGASGAGSLPTESRNNHPSGTGSFE